MATLNGASLVSSDASGITLIPSTAVAPPAPKPKNKESAKTKKKSAEVRRRKEKKRRLAEVEEERAVQQAVADPKAAWKTQRQARASGGMAWATIIWLGLLHVGALAAPFTFSWTGLGVLAFLCWLSGSVGICLGYHRLLTHRSFSVHKVTRWIIGWFGVLAGEGSPIDWVANHRQHHAHSDEVGDPHSPEDGAWWSHMLWLGIRMNQQDYEAHIRRWAPDMADDSGMRFLSKTFLLSHILLGLTLGGVGYALGGWYMAASLVAWGMFLRLVIVLHSTWFVNSATHMWGYRNYETKDQSRNLWWVALLTFGEGWHNNHHAYPYMAPAGHKWWEFDTTFWVIRGLQKVGLAWDVVDYKRKAPRRRRLATAE